MKTFLPQNKFYSTVPVPAVDEAGASALAPTPDAPADLSSAIPFQGAPGTAVIDSCQEPVAADLNSDSWVLHGAADGASRTDLLQALGALSGTDLINEIFAVKPKHFKLKHKRRLKLPRFAPDYEAMEAAMHNPGAPRALETDPVWADPKPLFLRDA